MKINFLTLAAMCALCNTLIGRALCLPLLLLLVTTAAVKAGDYTYTTNSDNTLTLTDYTGSGGDVVVPSTIDGKTVTSIGTYVFGSFSTFPGDPSISSVTIPDSVTSIGRGAFDNCVSMTNVTIGSGVNSGIGGSFWNDFSLISIKVDSGNHVYSTMDGVLFNKSGTTLMDYPQGKVGIYTIPNGVTRIEDGAFSDSSFSVDNPTSVIIPASVTHIGDDVFDLCYNMTGIYFKGNAPSLGSDAFGSATVLSYPWWTKTIYYLPWTKGWGSTFGGCLALPMGPLITANGLMGDVQLNSGDAVTITIQTMNIGPHLGIDVDWWVLLCTGSSWYYLNHSGQWKQFDWTHSHCHPIYQGDLFNLPATEVLNKAVLPAGSYTFYFGVDQPMDGILNVDGQISVDSVNVIVH